MSRLPFRRPAEPWLVLLSLAAMLLVFYWKNLFPIPFGQTFFWEDFVYQNYPYRAFLAEQLRQGVFPFWNPYQFAGMPYAADVQAAAFYPPNALLSLFVFDGRLDARWVELLEISHALAGGFLIALLVRYRMRCTYAATLAGAAWSLSGFFVVRMIHGNVLSVVAWLPLILLFFFISVDRRSVAAALLGGVVFGMSILGGAPQYSLFLMMVLGVIAMYEVIRPRQARTGAARFLPLALLTLLLMIGVAISAIQSLPTQELTSLSLRSEMPYDKSIEGSMPPASLATLLMPKLFGTAAGWKTNAYFGPGQYFYAWELMAYPGVVVLLLAGLALLFSTKEHGVLLFGLLTLFGLLLALGGYGPLHWIFYQVLPVYDKFRMPGRAMLIATFAIVILAARGAQILGKPPPRKTKKHFRRLLVLFAGFLVAGIIGYMVGADYAANPRAGMIPPGATARVFLIFLVTLVLGAIPLVRWARSKRGLGAPERGVLLLLVVAELFFQGYGFNDGVKSATRNPDPDSFYRGKSEVIDVMRREAKGENFRVKNRAPEGHLLLPRNQGSVNRLRSVDGYNQLRLQRYEDLQTAKNMSFQRIMDLFGVRVYTYLDKRLNALSLTTNPTARPRVYFVGDAVYATGLEASLAVLRTPEFDPVRSVLLAGTGDPVSTGATGEATLLHADANRFVVEVDCDGPGWLVMNEVYYPGWTAYVDGSPAEVLSANYTFRATPVGSGKSMIEWRFESKSFRLGRAITLVTLGVVLIMLLVILPRFGDSPSAAFREIWWGANRD